MIAGITGHQNLGDRGTISWVENCLMQEIPKYHITKGLTCLAIGADQLFAEVLEKFYISYIAIVPCDGYNQTFDTERAQKNYHSYLIKADDTVNCNFPAPSEEAFYAAGKYIVDHCDILFAIWNGKAAKGLGGTGDIVEYAKLKKKGIVHINPVTREIKIINRGF
jgi:hypothetical protein